MLPDLLMRFSDSTSAIALSQAYIQSRKKVLAGEALSVIQEKVHRLNNSRLTDAYREAEETVVQLA